MKINEIKAEQKDYAAVCYWLAEIAEQLAVLNANIEAATKATQRKGNNLHGK